MTEVRLEQSTEDDQETLREANAQLRAALDSISTAFALVDTSWRVRYMNRQGRRIFSARPAEPDPPRGRSFWEECSEFAGTPFEEAWRRAMAGHTTVEVEALHPHGRMWLRSRAYPGEQGLSISVFDITRQKRAEMRLESERKVLGLIASGKPLKDVLDHIAREAEQHSVDGMLCSILLLDADGKHLLHGAAPSLPKAYNDQIHGIAIGPGVGSCGTAAFERRMVWVTDIAGDPLWKEFRGLAAAHGLGACCSSPIWGSDGSVLGTIAMYYPRAWRPSDDDSASIDFAGRLASIAIERQCSEEALRRSEQFSRSVIESSRDCIKTLALDGRLTWINEQGCRALCIPDASEVIGRNWIDFWDDEARVHAKAAVLEAATSGIGSFVGRFPVQGKDRWWDVAISAIAGADGAPESLLAVSRDITERFEETRMLDLLNQTGAMLASTLDLRALLQNITDAATKLSGAEFGAFFYNIVDDNGQAFLLYTLSGAPREAFARFGHPRATPLFGPTFRGEGVIRVDDVRQDPRYGQWAPHNGMPEGHLPVRSYLAVPVVTRGGEVLGGLFFGHSQPGRFTERSERLVVGVAAQAAVAVDNARLYEASQKAAQERKQLLESERHARSAAEHAGRMKDEFLATLSHELRTPLSAVLGWAQVLRLKGAAPEMLKGLEAIERNARVQKELIEELLDMSRIASGKLRLDLQEVMCVSFVNAALETVRPLAQARRIDLVTGLDASGMVLGDPARLQQVVWNLLTNAIKFTPEGGRVAVTLRTQAGHAEIVVADSGQGIGATFLEHVFERFRQADGSTTRRHGGLGLGLAIVRNLVELHGGTVTASSPGEGQGATFTVRLPLAERARTGSRRASGEASTGDFRIADLSGVKVLVVDDQDDARELVARVLTECAAEVVTAAGAERALLMVERERPDVIVSDIGMPDIDGFEMIARVRSLKDARARGVPAIALTAFARDEDRERALKAGFAVHVAKPVEPAELVARVAALTRPQGDAR